MSISQINTITSALNSTRHERLAYNTKTKSFVILSRSAAKKAGPEIITDLDTLKGKIEAFVKKPEVKKEDATAIAQAFRARKNQLAGRTVIGSRAKGIVKEAKQSLEACAQTAKKVSRVAEQVKPPKKKGEVKEEKGVKKEEEKGVQQQKGPPPPPPPGIGGGGPPPPPPPGMGIVRYAHSPKLFAGEIKPFDFHPTVLKDDSGKKKTKEALKQEIPVMKKFLEGLTKSIDALEGLLPQLEGAEEKVKSQREYLAEARGRLSAQEKKLEALEKGPQDLTIKGKGTFTYPTLEQKRIDEIKAKLSKFKKGDLPPYLRKFDLSRLDMFGLKESKELTGKAIAALKKDVAELDEDLRKEEGGVKKIKGDIAKLLVKGAEVDPGKLRTLLAKKKKQAADCKRGLTNREKVVAGKMKVEKASTGTHTSTVSAEFLKLLNEDPELTRLCSFIEDIEGEPGVAGKLKNPQQFVSESNL